MAYTTAEKVFRSMERIEPAKETFTGVSNGDTLDLANLYPVKGTVVVTVDGNDQTEDTDYTVDYDNADIEYIGSDSGEAVVKYSFAPYSDSTVQNSIDAVESRIDDYTNSTYDGLSTVTDELYDSPGQGTLVYPFVKRPVRSIDSVEVNEPESGNNPNYVAKTEGLGDDYVDYKELGLRWVDGDAAPVKGIEKVKVTYDYGYSGVPSDLAKAATEMVVDDLVRGTVSGAMVDGRDNFDPQTIDVNVSSYQSVLDRYRVERMENIVNLAEEGNIS